MQGTKPNSNRIFKCTGWILQVHILKQRIRGFRRFDTLLEGLAVEERRERGVEEGARRPVEQEGHQQSDSRRDRR